MPGVHSLVWILNFISFYFLYPSTFNILEVGERVCARASARRSCPHTPRPHPRLYSMKFIPASSISTSNILADRTDWCDRQKRHLSWRRYMLIHASGPT